MRKEGYKVDETEEDEFKRKEDCGIKKIIKLSMLQLESQCKNYGADREKIWYTS